MINSYIEKINLRKEKNESRKLSIFGISIGFLLILFFLYKYISNVDNLKFDYIYILGQFIGIVLIVLTIINEKLVKNIHKIINGILNIVGMIIFKILLVVIYIVLVCPVGIFLRRKNQKKIVNSTFENKKNSNKSFIKRGSIILEIIYIFKKCINENTIYFIPILILLILIGVLLIFIQSNIAIPFIYTIF